MSRVRLSVTREVSELEAYRVAKIDARTFGGRDEYASGARVYDVANRPGSRLLLARADGELVGFNLVLDRGRYVEGVRIGVVTSWRRYGIARRLMQRSLRLARQLGKGYRAYVLASNVPSVNLHVRAGMAYVSHDESSYRENPRLWFAVPQPAALDMAGAA